MSSAPAEKEATGEVSPMEASLLQIGGWFAIEPWNLSVGLCGLAARALCPDLADLKSAGSQLTEHWLRCPGSPLHRLVPPLMPTQSHDKKNSWVSTDVRQGVRKQTESQHAAVLKNQIKTLKCIPVFNFLLSHVV